jgi:hypothetical protein
VPANLDSLLTALYVLADDLLPARSGAGRRPQITDSELITLAVAQVMLGCHSERRFLGLARRRLGHLFPYIPEQPAYSKRLRALAPRICMVITHGAALPHCSVIDCGCWTPRRCRAGPRARRPSALSSPAGPPTATAPAIAGSSGVWGLRLYLLCAPDGMPVSFCLAPANDPDREVAAALLERARSEGLLAGGELIVSDKSFASAEFEQIVASLDATLIRPDRKDEARRFGKLGRIRQWIESIYNTTMSQLSPEDHGGHIPKGVWARVCQRVLALAAGVWHNWLLWEAGHIEAPGRHFTSYDH